MKKSKKQPMSQGDQKMKEYHESIQEETNRKMREANPLMEGLYYPSQMTAGVASRRLTSAEAEQIGRYGIGAA